jgi:hypothetical protein
MASILKVDKIVDSGSNVLATSSGSGYAIDSAVTGIPATGVTGTLGSEVTFPAGHILQVVGDNYTTNLILTTNYVDILSVDIIPTNVNSKFVIMANIATFHASTGNINAGKLVRSIGGTEALNYELGDFYHPSGSGIGANISIMYYDSPGTTSSINYKIQAKEELGSGELNKDYNGTVNGVCSLIVQEIAG